MVDVCDCPPEVKRRDTIQPAVRNTGHAVAVILTICDCDRHTCTVNGCDAKVDPGSRRRCVNGHPG